MNCLSCHEIITQASNFCSFCGNPNPSRPGAAQNSESNSGQINQLLISGQNHGAINQYVQNQVHEGLEAAEFKRVNKQQFTRKDLIKKPAFNLLLGSASASTALFLFFQIWSGTSSILGILQGFQSEKIFIVWFGTLIASALTIVTLSQAWLEAKWSFRRVFQSEGSSFPYNKSEIKKESGRLFKYDVEAKCPIRGCTGELRTFYMNSHQNDQGYSGHVATCSEKGYGHMFEYPNQENFGNRLNLTMEKSRKSSSSN